MNLVWTGSDVIYATRYPKQSKKSKYIYMFAMHLFAKVADVFVQKHVVVSEHLIEELKVLKLKKPVEVRENPMIYGEPVKKLVHPNFNILYYRGLGGNQRFKDWVYGKDLVDRLKKELKIDMKVIEVNGEHNMREVYAITDMMVRPNRHDGSPRMIRECDINSIPYYYSREEPDYELLKKRVYEVYEEYLQGKTHKTIGR